MEMEKCLIKVEFDGEEISIEFSGRKWDLYLVWCLLTDRLMEKTELPIVTLFRKCKKSFGEDC